MYRYFFKRCLDILLSLIGIIVLAIPMVIIAIAVKCDSKGPAIFKTKRVGKNGKLFTFYKFRSMRVDAPKDCAPRLLQTDYTTKVGHFIRKTSLDELPQMFCIFVGTMSIIGPRPCGVSETDLIEARERYGANAVAPGLTGLAQVSGRDVLASNPEAKAKIDGEYAKKITFWVDLKIFFKTIKKVLGSSDIVEGQAVLEIDQKEVEEKAELEAHIVLGETIDGELETSKDDNPKSELTEMLSEAQKQAQTAEETA